MSGSLNLDTLVAIRDSSGLTPQEKLVLWTVYSRGAHHTGSMTTLATNMGYKDARQTRRLIAGLRDRNIIKVVEHAGGTHTITINTLVLQTLVSQDTPVLQDKGGLSSKTRGGCLTRQPKENIKENVKENLASAGAAADKKTSTNKDDGQHRLISEGHNVAGEARKDSNDNDKHLLISEGQEVGGGAAKQDSSSNKTSDDGGNDSKEQEGTLVVQDKGQEEIDYKTEAQTAGVSYYYEAALKVPTTSGRVRSPKSAYRMALRSAGKGSL